MVDARETAQLLLETIPNLMRGMVGTMRQHKVDDEALTMGQMRMLAVLAHAPRNLRDLAALHHVTPSTMSRTMDVLVRKDWVIREGDPTDRRQIILKLTEEGRAVQATTHQRLHEAMTQQIAQLIAQLDEADQDRLYDGLSILRKLVALAPNAPADCTPQYTEPAQRVET
jgi:DNA-binding MarR family transcriptional regulator